MEYVASFTFTVNIKKTIDAETSEEGGKIMQERMDEIVEAISPHLADMEIKFTPGSILVY